MVEIISPEGAAPVPDEVDVTSIDPPATVPPDAPVAEDEDLEKVAAKAAPAKPTPKPKLETAALEPVVDDGVSDSTDDFVDGDPTVPDREIDDILTDASALKGLKGDPQALASVDWDRKEVKTTNGMKETIAWKNGERFVIKSELVEVKEANIEQVIYADVKYDVEVREDGSRHLLGRTGEEHGGQSVMLTPPDIPGAVPAEEPEEEEEPAPPVQDPPTRGPDEPRGLTRGRLRPTGELIVSTGREVFLDDNGREMSEQQITITDSRINGGRPTNIPTIWDGVALGQADAVQAAMASGQTFPSHRSVEDAVEASKKHSAQIGRERAFITAIRPAAGVIGEIGRAVFTGTNAFVEEILKVAPPLADLADFMEEVIPLGGGTFQKPESGAGKLLAGVTQAGVAAVTFVRPFMFLNSFWRWTTTGGLIDFAAFSPDDPGLIAPFIKEFGEIDNVVLEAARQVLLEGLLKDVDDQEIEKRLKGLREGALIGLTIDGLVKAYSVTRKMRLPGPFGTVGRGIATMALTTLALTLSSDTAEAGMAKRILDALSAGGFKPAEPFFAVLIKRLEDSKQGSATGEQWLKMIDNMKQKGVKDEERYWTGVDDFLEENKLNKITRFELIDFVKEHQVEIKDVTLGPEFLPDERLRPQAAPRPAVTLPAAADILDTESFELAINGALPQVQSRLAAANIEPFIDPDSGRLLFRDRDRDTVNTAAELEGVLVGEELPDRQDIIRDIADVVDLFTETRRDMGLPDAEFLPDQRLRPQTGTALVPQTPQGQALTIPTTTEQVHAAFPAERESLHRADLILDLENSTGPGIFRSISEGAGGHPVTLDDIRHHLDPPADQATIAAAERIFRAVDEGIPTQQQALTPGEEGVQAVQLEHAGVNRLDELEQNTTFSTDFAVLDSDGFTPVVGEGGQLRFTTQHDVDGQIDLIDFLQADPPFSTASIESAGEISGAYHRSQATGSLSRIDAELELLRLGNFDVRFTGDENMFIPGPGAEGMSVRDLVELEVDELYLDAAREVEKNILLAHRLQQVPDAGFPPAQALLRRELELTPAEEGVQAAQRDDLQRMEEAGDLDSLNAEGISAVIDPTGQRSLLFEMEAGGQPLTLLEMLDGEATTRQLVLAHDAAAAFRGVDEVAFSPMGDDLDLMESFLLDVDFSGRADMFMPGPGAQWRPSMTLTDILDSGELSEEAIDAARRIDSAIRQAAELQGLRDTGLPPAQAALPTPGQATQLALPAPGQQMSVGEVMTAYPQTVQRIEDEGFAIGIDDNGNLFVHDVAAAFRGFDAATVREAAIDDVVSQELATAVSQLDDAIRSRQAVTTTAALPDLTNPEMMRVHLEERNAGANNILEQNVFSVDVAPDGHMLGFFHNDELFTIDQILAGDSGFSPELRTAVSTMQQDFDRLRGMGTTPEIPQTFRRTQHHEYVLAGGDNYREVLITLPRNRQAQWMVRAGAREGFALQYFGNRKQAQEFIDGSADKANLTLSERQNIDVAPYTGGHFDDENILVHMRLTERVDNEGKKVLFIEELQSDWFQAAGKLRKREVERIAERDGITKKEANKLVPRHFGFMTGDAAINVVEAGRVSVEANVAVTEFKRRLEGAMAERFQRPGFERNLTAQNMRRLYVEAPIGEPPTGQFGDISDLMGGSQPTSAVEEAFVAQNHLSRLEDAADLAEQRLAHMRATESGKYPDAPFKDTWHELAMRRVVRFAAENDFHRIAWTTGSQQVKRYKSALRKQVDEIIWTKTEDGIKIVGKQRGEVRVDTDLGENELSDAIGKAMSKQIIGDPRQTGTIKGEGITFNEPGMARFYDKKMRDYASKFGKKFKSKVGETVIPTRSSMQLNTVDQDTLGAAAERAYTAGDGEAAEAIERVATNFRAGMRSRSAYSPMTEDQLDEWLPEAIEEGTRETVHSLDVTDSMRETALSEGFPLFNLAAGAGATAAAAAATGGAPREAEAKSIAGQGQPLPGPDDVDLGGGAGNDQLTDGGEFQVAGVGKVAADAAKEAIGSAKQVLDKIFPKVPVHPKLKKAADRLKRRLKGGLPPIPIDKVITTERELLRAKRTAGAKPLGAFKNEHRVLKAPKGSGLPDIAIGGQTTQEWLDKVQKLLSPDEIKQAMTWYDDVAGLFNDKFSAEEGPIRMIAWLLANQNTKPAVAMLSSLRTVENMVAGIGLDEGLKGGLTEATLRTFLGGGKVEKGIGQKIFDFIDSALGRQTRTFYGDAPGAGAPAVADIWTLFDSGAIDAVRYDDLKDLGYDMTGVIKDYKTKTTSPTQNQYEHSADWVRNLTEELNGLGFGKDIGAGAPLEARQVQAIGWMAMTKMLRGRGQTAADALEQSSFRMAVEAAPATGSVFNSQYAARLKNLSGESQAKVNKDVTRKSIEVVSEELQVDIRGMYHATGGWTDEGVVKVNPTTLIEIITTPELANRVADALAAYGDQKEIWVSRIKGLTKDPKGAAIDIVEIGGHKMANQETFIKVWQAIEDADPTGLIGGFEPHIRPDGSVGMTILVNKGGEGVKRIIDGDVRKILEKALKQFDFDTKVRINEAGINVRRNDYEEKGFENGQGHLGRLEGAGFGEAGERIISRRGELEEVFEASLTREEAVAARHAPAFDGAGGPNQGQVGLRVQQTLLRERIRRGEQDPDDPSLEPGEYEAIRKELGIPAAAATIRGAEGAEASEVGDDPEVASLAPGQPSAQEIGIPPPPGLDPRLAGFWEVVFSPFIGRAGREALRNTPESFESRMLKQPPPPGAVEALERDWDKYRESDLFGEGVSPEGIDFNFSRMNTNADVDEQINNISRIYAQRIEETTGGVVPLKLTRQLADLMGADPDVAERAVKALPSDTRDLHVRTTVMRDMLVQAANDVDRRALAIKTSPDQVSDAEHLAFRAAFAKFAALARKMKGVQTDIARAESAFRINAEDVNNAMRRAQATQEALQIHGGRETSEDLAARWLKTPNDKKGHVAENGWWAKTRASVFEVWINGLLSSVRTHTINFVGNNLFTLWQIPERALAGVIGGVRQLLPNSNPDRVFIRESAALMHGYLEGFPEGARLAWETWKTGMPSRGLDKMETAGRRAISAQEWGADPSSWLGRGIDLLGGFVRLSGKALMTADEFNRAAGHRSQRRALAFRQSQTILDDGRSTKEAAEAYADVMGGKLPDIEEAILNYGDMVTFTGALGDKGKAIQSFLSAIPLARVIVPFFRTPANIFKEFLKRTPIGAPFLKEVREDFLAGGARRDLAISRIGMGTSAMAFGAYLTSQGILTGGGPTDPRMRSTWLRAGNQPYSIKIGDEWYPYGRLEPLGLLLGVAADFAEFRQWAPADIPSEDEDLLLTRAVASVIHTVSKKTFLMGIAELSAAYHDPDRYAQTFISRLTGSVMPYSSMVRDIETAVDRPRRTTRVDPYAHPARKQLNAALNSVQERTPGWSSSLPGRLNFWGEEIKAFDGEWYQAFNAFRPRKIKKSPIDNELLRLRFPLTKPRGEIGGVKLDPQQGHDFIKAYNEVTVKNPVTDTDMTLREGLNWLVTKSGFYKVAISDEQRIDMIREIRDLHVGKAREAMTKPGTKYFDADLRDKGIINSRGR